MTRKEMVIMSYLIQKPLIMVKREKTSMTRFARTIEPGIKCNYEKISDTLFVVKVDFDKKESYDLFAKRYWGL